MSLPNELRQSLEALAAPASRQLDLFPDLHRSADALALDFEMWRDTVLDDESSALTGPQARALAELDAQLIAMSGRQNAHLWTEEALRESTVWQRIRDLAQSALDELGWAREPSGSQPPEPDDEAPDT